MAVPRIIRGPHGKNPYVQPGDVEEPDVDDFDRARFGKANPPLDEEYSDDSEVRSEHEGPA